MRNVKFHTLNKYHCYGGAFFEKLSISYQVFGQRMHTAPVVLVNHALTGNSDLASDEKGWWREIVGANKLIDTKKYTIIAFDIPGNGYCQECIENYKDFSVKDIARIFYMVLNEIGVKSIYAAIGASLGGGIVWQMGVLYPEYAEFLIPIATDWKSTDWVIGLVSVQEDILHNSEHPLEDARKMAMFFYRTPASFTQRFNRSKTMSGKEYNVVSWLNHHGKKLEKRFERMAYLFMNHLLGNINILNDKETIYDALRPIRSTIIQISIDSDLLFAKEEIIKTKNILNQLNINNEYHEIQSIDGHDAFLIEHVQITQFLKSVFCKQPSVVTRTVQTGQS